MQNVKIEVIKRGFYEATYGAEHNDCPYWPGTLAHVWWVQGYNDAVRVWNHLHHMWPHQRHSAASVIGEYYKTVTGAQNDD